MMSSAVCVAALTLLFSSLAKNQMAALVVSAAAYLFPLLLPVPGNQSAVPGDRTLPAVPIDFCVTDVRGANERRSALCRMGCAGCPWGSSNQRSSFTKNLCRTSGAGVV